MNYILEKLYDKEFTELLIEFFDSLAMPENKCSLANSNVDSRNIEFYIPLPSYWYWRKKQYWRRAKELVNEGQPITPPYHRNWASTYPYLDRYENCQ